MIIPFCQIISIQNSYSLLNRADFESGLTEVSLLSLMALI